MPSLPPCSTAWATGWPRPSPIRVVRAVILTHTGSVFCAGADISSGRGTSNRAAATGDGRDPDPGVPGSVPEVPAPRFGLADVLSAIQDSPKPVIARIAGHCLGGGVGLAAACDLSIASEDARFGFTEVRLGVIPAIISVVCLPKLRRSDALELFLTGQRVGAARAAAVGLITTAVAAGDLDEAVQAAVAQVLAGGPAALAAAKRLVFDIPTMERADAFRWTTELSESVFASEEAAEGIAAFREKRPPSWQPPSPPAGS